MIELPFGTDGVSMIMTLRSEATNIFFQFISYMGEVEGYILIITFIYMLLDKKLAFRLSLFALLSMSLNHLLKSIIGMPRPFVNEGAYIENWLVSKEKALELVTEYSTPSGHAMSSSAFYGYLLTTTNKRILKLLLLLAILLVGISRPYLAVHYIEDILLGWIFGGIIIFIATKYFNKISSFWNRLSLIYQLSVLMVGSFVLWIITFFINGGDVASQPLPFVGYLGFLLGVCLGYSLEEKYLGFDPKSKGLKSKLLRWVITIVLVMMPVIILDEMFETVWGEPTISSHLLQYFGYALSGFLGIFLAPFIFLKLNLVDTISDLKIA